MGNHPNYHNLSLCFGAEAHLLSKGDWFKSHCQLVVELCHKHSPTEKYWDHQYISHLAEVAGLSVVADGEYTWVGFGQTPARDTHLRYVTEKGLIVHWEPSVRLNLEEFQVEIRYIGSLEGDIPTSKLEDGTMEVEMALFEAARPGSPFPMAVIKPEGS